MHDNSYAIGTTYGIFGLLIREICMLFYEERRFHTMNGLKIAKLVVQVVGIGVTIATTIIANKELDTKITEKVAEALKDK